MAICKIQSRAPSILPEGERLKFTVFLLALVLADVSSHCSGWYVRVCVCVCVCVCVFVWGSGININLIRHVERVLTDQEKKRLFS